MMAKSELTSGQGGDMPRILRAVLLAMALTLALAGPTLAAKPNHTACFGSDISGYATTGGGLHYLPPLVQAPGPWGQVIQAHQAGLVPDAVIPNSCND
jgi:hypothetical protein